MMQGIIIHSSPVANEMKGALLKEKRVDWHYCLPDAVNQHLTSTATPAGLPDEVRKPLFAIVEENCDLTLACLSDLIRAGYHLFLPASHALTTCDMEQLNNLAEEGKSLLAVRNDTLAASLTAELLQSNAPLKLIEIHHTAPGRAQHLTEILYNSMVLIHRIAGNDISKINATSIQAPDNQPEIITIQLTFSHGSIANIILSFVGNHCEHLLDIHSEKGITRHKLLCTEEFSSLATTDLLAGQLTEFITAATGQSGRSFTLNDEYQISHLISKINRKLRYDTNS